MMWDYHRSFNIHADMTPQENHPELGRTARLDIEADRGDADAHGRDLDSAGRPIDERGEQHEAVRRGRDVGALVREELSARSTMLVFGA